MPVRSSEDAVVAVAGRLIVSCQASNGSPLRHTPTIARLAASALRGGAAALRVNGVHDIAAVRESTHVPIIGLDKRMGVRRNVITQTDEQVVALVDAGADIVAVDATLEVVADVAARVRSAITHAGVAVMADVSTFDEGMAAWDAGATFVGTTLSGYTPYSPQHSGPDLDLVRDSRRAVFACSRRAASRRPTDVAAAFEVGAHAVVVGGAITDPIAITRRFVAVTPGAR